MTIETRIHTRCNEIWLDDSGILRVTALNTCEIDLEEAKACFDAYEKLGCHENPTVQLMDVRLGVTLTREARDYAANIGARYFKASAVVSSSLTARLIVNFFERLYPNAVPLKLFSNEADALKWLAKYST